MFNFHEASLKTAYFEVKSGNCMIFNCPDLKVGAIYAIDILGFSHINKIYSAFFDWTDSFQ